MKLTNLKTKNTNELIGIYFFLSSRQRTRKEMTHEEWNESMEELENEIKERILTNKNENK